MNKKLFSILFTLFLVGVLSVSCSNKDKTSQSTGIDSKYAGTWKIESQEEPSLNNQQFTINKDGSMAIPDKTIPASEIIKNSETSYTITLISELSNDEYIKRQKTIITIEFITTTSGNIKYNVINTHIDNSTKEFNFGGTLTRQ